MGHRSMAVARSEKVLTLRDGYALISLIWRLKKNYILYSLYFWRFSSLFTRTSLDFQVSLALFVKLLWISRISAFFKVIIMIPGENLRNFPPFFFNSAAEEEKMPRKVEGKKEKTPKKYGTLLSKKTKTWKRLQN